jgi:hypothetical protein
MNVDFIGKTMIVVIGLGIWKIQSEFDPTDNRKNTK